MYFNLTNNLTSYRLSYNSCDFSLWLLFLISSAKILLSLGLAGGASERSTHTMRIASLV